MEPLLLTPSWGLLKEQNAFFIEVIVFQLYFQAVICYWHKDPALICFSRENGLNLTVFLTNIKFPFTTISVSFDKKLFGKLHHVFFQFIEININP